MLETRNITEVKVWILQLNNMRDPKIEISRIVAISDSREKLENWYNEQKTEAWTDESEPGKKWGKSFKKGSELEWYNPVSFIKGPPDSFGHGIYFQWIPKIDLEANKIKFTFI